MSRFATTRELCCGSIQDIITKVFMWLKKKSENDRPIATTKLLGVQITINLIAVSECDEKKAHCEISKNILPPPTQSRVRFASSLSLQRHGKSRKAAAILICFCTN